MRQVRQLNIWDLDGTVINSFHRVQPCLRPNGDLDLNKYAREACTHEMIMGDTLLPLAEYMLKCLSSDTQANAIVTARRMNRSDYYFLRRQGMRGRGSSNVQLMSRDTLHRYAPHLSEVPRLYYSRDADYKAFYFEQLRKMYPVADITVYDDHKGVLAVARDMGFNAIDATMVNEILSMGVRSTMEEMADEQAISDADYASLAERTALAWHSMTELERSEYESPTDYIMQLLAS
ncbi:putative deoxynucleoside-5'-monophosphatase [Pectobacterium phage DU_PP_V]|uniref:Putative deoxynucleoside-5'-monophosphatase n=1 Tax=Pectobacterium phage DU_PP_V TaxID=2041492 RepID=A0A2D2W6Q6_9CAUD|nr:putative deoxynucleoside-5'-monophosphatase [Pectobacterium phage DU_PP_V]ATS93985.1 putative deoxynucleoside-5'-monophosphatase [Pectobacterium phage DU_PP_V]